MRLKYVDLPNLYYLTEGLALNLPKCAEVLDNALIEFNKKSKIPDKIVKWNSQSAEKRLPLIFSAFGRIIVDLTQYFSPEKGMMYLAKILNASSESAPPTVFVSMHSPSLDIPMRFELPLRAILKGGRDLRGRYIVYLHALVDDEKNHYVYYGITKRGWNNRFMEHAKDALAEQSGRLFPRKLSDLAQARVSHLCGQTPAGPQLAGIISTLCSVGLDETQAMDMEEYLIKKYSLASKHTRGLNMIPGGREGIRSLHLLSLGLGRQNIETDEREELFSKYSKSYAAPPRTNSSVAQHWNDSSYAEAVICGRDNRLRADQVREIRYLAILGYTTSAIKSATGALDDGQVARVLSGRTYSRIS